MMTKTAEQSILDLGLLDLKNEKIYINSLPSKCRSVIVNYSDRVTEDYDYSSIRISCIIPSRAHKVFLVNGPYLRNNDINSIDGVKVPTLLLSGVYADIPRKDIEPYGFWLYGLCRDKSKVRATPYVISNVHPSGQICLGGDVAPNTLRSAYNLFWSIPFNNELDGAVEGVAYRNKGHLNKGEDEDDFDYDDYDYEGISDDYCSLEEYIRSYKENVFSKQIYKDITNIICGTKYWASPRGYPYVLVTSNKSLLKKIPNKYWRQKQDISFIIAGASLIKNNWRFNTGTIKFSIPKENIII